MTQKQDIESKIDQTLEVVKKISQVEAPAFFTEKTLNRLRNPKVQRFAFSGMPILKIAAIIVLLIVNVYTIQYIMGTNEESVTDSTITVKDLVNDYQPNDATELTFEQKLNK